MVGTLRYMFKAVDPNRLCICVCMCACVYASYGHKYITPSYIHTCTKTKCMVGYLGYSEPIFGQLHSQCSVLEGVRGNHLVTFWTQTAGNGVHQRSNKDSVIPVSSKVLQLPSW